MRGKIISMFVMALLILIVVYPMAGQRDSSIGSSLGEILDQHQDWSDGCLLIDNNEWQEFIPAQDNLVRVEVKVVQWYLESPDLKLTIEQPLGTVLTQKKLPATSLPSTCDWASFDVPDIVLVPDNSYYIKLTAPQGSEYGWGFAWNDLYPQGESSQPPGDWCFKTYAEEAGNLCPTVNIIYPQSGSVVNGTITVTGEAHDPNGDTDLEWVSVKIDDGDWDYATGTSSWSYIWDTTTVNDGTHSISAIASDGSLQSTVDVVEIVVDNGGELENPDLIVTDIWEESDRIYYQIRNNGNKTAIKDHLTALFIDNTHQISDKVDNVLYPGERYTSWFDYGWDCTKLNISISVIADCENLILESNESNNGRREFWKCDTNPPKIINGPVVQSITQNSAVIYWRTDENSDSTLKYDNKAEEFSNIIEKSERVVDHYVTLTGLQPSTIYHYLIESKDSSENIVRSKDDIFKTSSIPDNMAPSVSLSLPKTLSGILNVSVDARDNVGIDHVILFCDDDPIYSLYSPPYEWIVDTTSFGEGSHDFSVDAFDDSGNQARDIEYGDVRHHFPPNDTPIVIEFDTPVSDPLHPTEVCGWVDISGRIWSEDYYCISYANITINDNLIWESPMGWDSECDMIPPDEHIPGVDRDSFIYRGSEREFRCVWDTYGLPFGLYEIKVEAMDEVGNKEKRVIVVYLVEYPYEDLALSIDRDVTWFDNYAKVTVSIYNIDTFTANNLRIKDEVLGFQVTCNPDLIINAEIFDYAPPMVEIIDEIPELRPSQHYSFSYYLVPIISQYSIMRVYEIGRHTINITYENPSGKKYSNEYPCPHETYTISDLDNVFKDADYLIVTKPSALFISDDKGDVNTLLSLMAELARLKNGVLGYIIRGTDEYGLKSLISPGGDFYDLLSPEHLGGGAFDYLLLVGEDNIVPSFFSPYFTLNWNGGGPHVANFSDHPFGDILGNSKPDISVGRIIGNHATKLIQPIQASIGVHNHESGYDFDRSNALLVSGTGENGDKFVRTINNIEDIIERDTTVDKIHWKDYYVISSFPRNVQNHDGLESGDVQGDTKDEIILADRSEDHIYILDKDGNEIGGFDFMYDFDEGDGLAIGNLVTSDDKEEIIIGSADQDKIYIVEVDGSIYPSLDHSFQELDGLAVGDVISNSNNEIIIADRSDDKILVYNRLGTLLREFNCDFEKHDGFAVGDVMGGYKDEIIIGDRSRDKFYIYDAEGDIHDPPVLLNVTELNIQSGDGLTTGDVYNRGKDAIIIGDRSKDKIHIYLYQETIGKFVKKESLHFDFGEFDGIATGNVMGTSMQEILIGDTSDDYIRITDVYTTRLFGFKSATMGKDIIVFADHGNLDIWSPVLSTGDFPIRFGTTHPVILAHACLTGDYKSGNGYNIAEAFFDSGAAVYIGATQVSPVDKYNPAGRYFFQNWEFSECVGDAFLELERSKYDNDYHCSSCSQWWKFWVWEHNLYGDPKFGQVIPTSHEMSDNTSISLSSRSMNDSLHTLEFNIPDYEVSSEEDIDYVELPGGDILSEVEGRPLVPYYTATIEYPKGYHIQAVTLKERTNLMETTGLNLPVVTNSPFPEEQIELKEGWYPKVDYSWRTEQNNDDITLIISMYPFYYNQLTTNVRFYKNYKFDIEYIYSDVTIAALYTDHRINVPGDEMKIHMWLNNKANPQTIVTNLVIKEYGLDEVIKGFPLTILKDCNGLCKYSTTFDTSNFKIGSYYLQLTISDIEGNILDSKILTFGIDIPSTEINITSISGGFGISAGVENNGVENATDVKWSITIEGDMVFLGGYREGIISLIKPGERKSIASGLVFGFGSVDITVNVAGLTKKTTGFLLGPFVLAINK